MRHLFCLLVFLCGFSLHAQAKTPRQFAVATAHPLATEAGVQILQQGGNAFDAAAAISAALSVVEPYGSGLGGGGFWLLHRQSDQRQRMIDGRETASALARHTMYLDKNGGIVSGLSLNGPLAAGIPGIPAGIDHLIRQYGRMPLKQILAPAIALADGGFPVTERYRKLAGFRLEVMRRYADTAAIFLRDNAIPQPGEMIRQPELADTLRQMAEKGIDDFYRGEIAERLIDGVSGAGGNWRARDLADYRIKERPPVIFNYHNMRIVSAPLPSSGGVVLAQALGILERFDLDELSESDRRHVVIEAMRRAYRDRAAYLGDSDYVRVPVDRLLHEDYLEGMAIGIEMHRATTSAELSRSDPDYRKQGENTTHFSVLDTEGNRVAATLSINLPFGSGFTVPGTGILLNNEMDDFAIKPNTPNAYGLVGDHANLIEPGKRPLSSMTPTFVETPDRIGILGTPGGSRIISMVLLSILDMAKGTPPGSWVAAPRYHHQFLPDTVQFEQGGLTPLEQRALIDRGHTLSEKNRRYGNMQAIMWWKLGNLVYAASDPRGEGAAAVLWP